MKLDLSPIRIGLALVISNLLFGIFLGVAFGANEEFFKDFISVGIAANPEVHDAKSPAKIWRYVQRTHFHATGIAAFSLGLIILTLLSRLRKSLVRLASFCIGLGSFYPLTWFSMFILAPSLGRGPAHEHIFTQFVTYFSVSGLLAGLFILIGNLFFDLFCDKETT